MRDHKYNALDRDLKHSFYQSFNDENYHDLKTLPNIDIKIKCGNSLVYYFEISKSLNHYPNIKERTDKLISKMLRGGDIKIYSYELAGLWVINTHNGYKGKNGEKVEAINIDHYPSLKRHFDEFYPQLEKRTDKGLTPYNLRNCTYLEEFEKENIVYPCIMPKEPCFSYEKNYSIAMAQANTITLELNILKYLIAFLNSDFIYLMLRKFYIGVGWHRR